MSSPFFVLESVYDQPQIGQEHRTTDEVARVQPGGIIYTKGRNLAQWMRTNGFAPVIDPDGLWCSETGALASEAAEVLGVPVGAVHSMIRAGKFITYERPGGDGTIVLLREQVEAVARQRAIEAAKEEAARPKKKKRSSKEDDK